MSKLYNAKIALEQQLPTASQKLKTTNECLFSSIISLVTCTGKVIYFSYNIFNIAHLKTVTSEHSTFIYKYTCITSDLTQYFLYKLLIISANNNLKLLLSYSNQMDVHPCTMFNEFFKTTLLLFRLFFVPNFSYQHSWPPTWNFLKAPCYPKGTKWSP